MRPCFILAGFVLVLAPLTGCAARPQPPRAAGAQPSDRVWTVSGYGETKNDAQQRALDNARASVETWLDERFHDLGWSPAADELVRMGAVRVDEPKPGTFGEIKGYEAVAHVDVNDPQLRKMQGKVDEARERALEPVVTERHAIVGRFLAAFVALFLVMAGYLRLEELTRGYYTTLLRLGAAAVVLLTVLGLFLVA
jgi:hypothetical protein